MLCKSNYIIVILPPFLATLKKEEKGIVKDYLTPSVFDLFTSLLNTEYKFLISNG